MTIIAATDGQAVFPVLAKHPTVAEVIARTPFPNPLKLDCGVCGQQALMTTQGLTCRCTPLRIDSLNPPLVLLEEVHDALRPRSRG